MKKAIPPQQTELFDLPYEQITAVASRDTLREIGKAGRQTMFLEIGIIQARGNGYKINQGFNPRIQPEDITFEEWKEELEIKELAADLLENGMSTPLEGDLTADGKIFFLTEGFRRKLAIEHLISEGHTEFKNGNKLHQVEVLTNPRHWTEEDRIVRSLTSDNKLKFKPIEIATKILLLKTTFKRTNEEIGKRLGGEGKSRQYVDSMLKLAQEPESIQKAISQGKLSHTTAIALINAVKDPQKREDIVSDAIEKGATLSVKEVKEMKETYDYKDKMGMVVTQYKDGKINYSVAQSGIIDIALHALEIKSDTIGSIEFAKTTAMSWLDDATPGEDDEDAVTFDPTTDIEYRRETDAANDVEEESHKTSSKTPANRPKNQREDALEPIDFTKDRVLGEMELNEATKMLDKLNVGLDSLPSSMAGQKKDWQGLIVFVQNKIKLATEIIKKAGDTR